MPDQIGRIPVPTPEAAGSFPLVTDFGHGRAKKRNVVVHQFGDHYLDDGTLNNRTGKVEQRFFTGDAATRYTFRRKGLNYNERKLLVQFWDSTLGGTSTFFYNAPQEDQTFQTVIVRFEDQPLTLESLQEWITTIGLTFVAVPDPATAPVYPINATVTRFPDAGTASTLLDQVQDVIPLIHIRVIDTDVPDIFLSDRRATVGTNLYLPRLLNIGDQGSGVLLEQSIEGGADNTQFTFGNADRVMTKLANNTELKKATLELSLYFVNNAVKLDLWAGEIVDWSLDKGPEFTIQASDIISALTLQSPVRNISRTCWRIVANPVYACPAAPGSTCDLGYDTPDGCLVKGGIVPQSFGGQYVRPQAVTIKDNSTGTIGGFGRDLITPTSMINDSIYGGTLPEIWHNDDGIPQRGLPVNCRMVDGRDESDFYDGLGIVGRGPIGAYTQARMYDSDGDGKAETFIGSTLDGQPHHGFRQTDSRGNYTDSGFGLRQVTGTDPAQTGDYFSLGRVAGVPSNPREVLSAGEVFENNYAAGTAFMEIRRTDQKGIQPSEVTSHNMVAMISRGLAGWIWGGIGARSSVDGLTNPFWVCVNSLVRSLLPDTADAPTMEQYFNVDAAVQCGNIADTQVPALFGGGVENTFRFKGTLDTLKPLRDRLQEILNNCMGFFIFSFGKMQLGCRNSATPTSMFQPGNMLFQSLRLGPLKPQFEKLTIEFADTEYLFQKNTVDYTDQDYALRNNRVQNPRASQLGLLGCSTKSQAARIAVMRTREELGGVGLTEQTSARIASFGTTILALDTYAGSVIGITDPDVPDGFGAFRIQKWALNRDWSIAVTAKTVTDSMYDLTQGTKPVDVGVTKQPTQADIDTGPPPEPFFQGQVAPDNIMAAEVYDLTFETTVNTRTITQGTFTFYWNDPTIVGGPINKKVISTSFPYDFFLITPPATTYQAAELEWVLKCELPGMHVSRIDGFVTNLYGDSPVHTILVDLQLAGLPKSTTDEDDQYLESYDATSNTFVIRHFVNNEVPAGAMDGVNQVFTLAHAPIDETSVELQYNGVKQVIGVDIGLSGNTITFLRTVNLPDDSEGESLRCGYRW